MSLLYIIILILVVGVILYLINRFVPMDSKVKVILNWVVIIFLIIFLLRALGVFDFLKGVKV